MHTGTLKKLALALTFWLALHMSSLKAQVLGPYTDSSATLEVDSNGIFYVTGAGTGTLSLSGAGTRMFWYPKKAAFRAGYVNGTQWNDANIGHYSTAFGDDTTASGNYSTASGYYSTASGSSSVAMGNYSTASGYSSVAMGVSPTANGDDSVAMGCGAHTSGFGSVAIGVAEEANAWDSIVIGSFSTASASFAIAIGRNNTASGYYSMALGNWTIASGDHSMASGYNTTASAYDSFVIGQYNTDKNEAGSTPNSTAWVSSDPLFEIGNGTQLTVSPYTLTKSDALVVYKDGSAKFAGAVQVPQSGDIPMYTGN